MARTAVDITPLEKSIQALESIATRRREGPGVAVDQLYYGMLLKYLRRIRDGWQEGKFLVMHTTMVPVELLYAFDIVPIDLEYASTIMSQLVGIQQESLGIAKAYGFTPEICTNHHMVVAANLKGWLPPPQAVVWMKAGCDNVAQCGKWVMELQGVPGFYVDKLYRRDEAQLAYLVRELEDLIAFLEEQTGQRINWDRLLEAMRVSSQVCQVHYQIRALRKTDPPPMRSRRKLQLVGAGRIFAGHPEALAFYQAVLEECSQRMSSGLPPARFRLLGLTRAPHYAHKLYDWMENEHQAYMVMETNHEYRAMVEVNEQEPLKTLVQRLYQQPGDVVWEGPAIEGYVPWAVADAKEFRANGALFFAHRGCRQACGTIHMLKDALQEQVGIPTAVIDCDLVDPSVAPMEQMKEKLEEFFEMLEQ